LEERAQGLGDRFGLGMQPAGGQPDDAVAGELQCGVAGAVALERKAGGAVVGVAVEFDDEPLGGPERVDGEAGGQDVGGGRRQGVVADEGGEGVLEGAAGVGWGCEVLDEGV
jgi:hypothetical protein